MSTGTLPDYLDIICVILHIRVFFSILHSVKHNFQIFILICYDVVKFPTHKVHLIAAAARRFPWHANVATRLSNLVSEN